MVNNSAKRALIAMLVVLAFASFPAVLSANHSWNGYHWARSNNPFNINLGKNVGSKWKASLLGASSDWSQSAVLNTTVVSGGSNKVTCPPTSGRVEVCAYTYGTTGWLGIAQIWVNGKHITQGTVEVNNTYFNTPQYNKPEWRNLVMCQEIGHTFGLNHQDTNFNNTNLGTCMDYTSNPLGPPDNEHPNTHDYDELVTIYSHVDAADVIEMEMPPAMKELQLSGPGQWGKLIQGSQASGTSLYELDFGRGFKVFTFVTWAK